MIENPATICVIDDDPAVRTAVARLLQSEGYVVQRYASATEFLEARESKGFGPVCVVSDLSMPGLSGLDLQNALAASDTEYAIVFITGHGSIPSTVEAMKKGAVDFLTKPFGDAELLRAVHDAVEKLRCICTRLNELRSTSRRLAVLTPREREVLQHVVAGRLNKQIAADLGTVEKTIKVHRARVMEKMEVHSVAELVRLCERANRSTSDLAN